MSDEPATDALTAASKLYAEIESPDRPWLVDVSFDDEGLIIQLTHRLKLVDRPPQFPEGYCGYRVRYQVVGPQL